MMQNGRFCGFQYFISVHWTFYIFPGKKTHHLIFAQHQNLWKIAPVKFQASMFSRPKSPTKTFGPAMYTVPTALKKKPTKWRISLLQLGGPWKTLEKKNLGKSLSNWETLWKLGILGKPLGKNPWKISAKLAGHHSSSLPKKPKPGIVVFRIGGFLRAFLRHCSTGLHAFRGSRGSLRWSKKDKKNWPQFI